MINDKNQNLIIVIFITTLILIIAIITIIYFGQKQPSEGSPTPSPTNAIITPVPHDPPAVEYDTKKSNELLTKLKNRQILSQADILAKEKILALLPAGQKSGVVYSTGNIVIDYINTANVFQVEILITDIVKAKNEGIAWFRAQGVSQLGICNYPVQFYLNYEVSRSLKDDKIIFNHLAEGC